MGGLLSPFLSQKSQKLCSLHPREEQGAAAGPGMGLWVREEHLDWGEAPSTGWFWWSRFLRACAGLRTSQKGQEARGVDNQKWLELLDSEEGADNRQCSRGMEQGSAAGHL